MFESLSDRLSGILDKLTRRGALSAALKEFRETGRSDALYDLDPGLAHQMHDTARQREAALEAAAQKRANELADAETEHQRAIELEQIKGGKPTDDMREYDAAVEGGFEGSFSDYQVQLRQAGRANTSLTVDQRGEGEYSKVLGKGLAEQHLAESQRGRLAAANLDRVQAMRVALTSQDEGVLQGAEAGFKRWLGNFGINVDGGPQEMMVSLRESMIPALHTTPGPMTDADARMYRAVLPRLVNTREGNMLIMDMMEAANRYDLEVSKIAQARMDGDINNAEYNKQIAALGSPVENFTKKIAEFREASPEFKNAVRLIDSRKHLLNDEEYDNAISAIRSGAPPKKVMQRILEERNGRGG